jgi:hypothetical protein
MNLIHWDEDKFLEVVEMLLNADEVERALLLLDNPPGYYRDHPTEKMTTLRAKILSAMITAHAYMSSGLDANVMTMPEHNKFLMNHVLRGRLIKAEVERYNAKSISPTIVDVGPGEYFIPLGLKANALSFRYRDIVMDQNTQKVAYPLLEVERALGQAHAEGPVIFVALEIIEHLADPRELAVEALRHCHGWPDRIHLSTPLYCFDGAKKEWDRPCGLPHLRTYVPRELIREAQRIFPGYEWEFHMGQPMSLRGQRSDTIDREPLTLTGNP